MQTPGIFRRGGDGPRGPDRSRLELEVARSRETPGGAPVASEGALGRPGASGRIASWTITRLAAYPLVRRVASGAFWSLLGAGLSRALALGAAILVARQLGARTFGEYNLVQSTAGVFQAISGFGLGLTTTKYLSGRYRGAPEAAGRIVALSGLVAAATGVLAMSALSLLGPWIARELLHAPQLGGALRVGSLLLLFAAIQGAQLGVLMGLERFRLLALVSVISASISVPLLVLGAREGGLLGGVAGLVAAAAATTALHWGAVRLAIRSSGIRPLYRQAFAEWRVLFSFSLPATLSDLLLAPVTWVSSAMIASQADGLRQIGLFSAANQWRNAIVFGATTIGAALLPVFSHLHDSGRPRAFLRALWTSFAVTGAICLAAAAVLSALSPWLMRAYGAEFASATRVLTLLAMAGAIAAPLSVVGQAIAGVGRMWLGFALNLVWASCLLLLTYHLRSRGAEGLSVANLAAYFVHLVTSLGCVYLMARGRAPRAEAS